MIEAKLTKKYFDIFLKNLRYEDDLELNAFKNENFLNDFFNICSDNSLTTYFVLDDLKNPLALGGVCEVSNQKYKTARVWLLCSKYLNNSKIELYKYVKNKLLKFQKEYDILFNFIYKSNFDALSYLKKFDFEVVELKKSDYKLFYFVNNNKKGEFNFDIRYFTC